MRRRGYDVIAKPVPPAGQYDILMDGLGYKDIFDGAQWIYILKGTGEKEIEAYMKQWGDSARAEIAVAWKSNYGGGAHAFVVENIDGKIYYVSPQNSRSNAASYFKDVRGNFTRICRIDNLKPTKLILECCEAVSKDDNS